MSRVYFSRFRNLFVIGAYFFLALALTYPLFLHFGTHVLGTEMWAFDEYSFVWSQWWLKRAVFDSNADPLFSRMVFYPLGLPLASFTMLWANAVVGLPIQLAFGGVPATNATVLATFVLGAFGMYLLTRYLFQISGFKLELETFCAFAAGAVFAFSSSRMVYAALGHYTVLTTQWFPFYILFLVKTLRASGWKHPLIAGLFAALALYSDAAHAPLLVLFTLIFLAFERRRLVGWNVLARLGIVGATTALFFAPLLFPLLNEFVFSGYKLPGWGHAEKLLVDLVGLLSPTSLHPLNRYWIQELDAVRQGNSRFVDVNTVFLGYATLAFAALGAWVFRRRLALWIVSAITFVILSLGPLLHINGKSLFVFDGLQVTFPMPFLLLHYIPFLKENRVPNRYSILVMLSLAVLIAFALAWASQKIKAKSQKLVLLLPFTFLLLTLFEHLALPLPLSDARVPAVYAQLAREPGDFAILSLPLGWRNSFTTQGAEDTRTQYYQTVHNKYLLSGNTSRSPVFLFEYFDRISLLHSLSEIQLYRQVSLETLARDRAEASRLAAFFDIRYVVVNAAVPNRLPYSDTRDATLDYLRQVMPLGEKIYDRDGVVAYRVNQAELPARQHIVFGTDAAYIYQAEGWERPEVIGGEPANWSNRQSARVLFPLREITDYRVTVRALPFTFPQSTVQTMELVVNEQSIQKFELKAGWENYTATIPAHALRIGVNDLVLRFGYAVRPRDVLPANFAIGTTGVSSPVNIVVSSGTLGSIQVDGHELSKMGRGYNIVVIDPQTGNIIASRVFNTADDIAQSRALTDFLAQVRDGSIVAVAAQENAGANLGERTVGMLRSIGAQVDLRQTPNRAHAIIGVKGATPGTAIEQSSDGDVFISVGRNVDERMLSVAVSAITIEPK